MSLPFKERRAFERAGASAPLTIIIDREPKKQFDAISKNMSTRSIGFETEAPIEVDDRITLQMQTISGPVSIEAVVVRKDCLMVGCLFVDMPADVTAKIKKWLFPPFEP